MAPSPANMYAELLRHDLCAFIHRTFLELNSQTRFLSNWHIEVLAARLEEVRRGSCKRLIVNVPPRHLKSHATSIAFPAWVLGHEPTKQILFVTYAQDLSDKLARESRTLMTSPFYEGLFDTRLSKGREAVSEYETTDGGYRLSTSIGGVLTGRGADIIIIDDPLKADDALSESRRRSVNEWYDNTLRSRLNSQEKGAIIIVMQRLHADDLVAHVQEHESWDVLSFPAIAEHNETYDFLTPYGRKRIHRKNGEILQAALLSPATLESQRRAMTEYNFTAQYQQNPQPPSGIIVKREWLKFYGPNDKPEPFDQKIQSWDTANKDTELSNFSVCTTWGLKDQHMFLLDVYRRRVDFPDLKRAVRELAALHHPNVVLVEDKASGTSLIQELRADNFSLVEAAPGIDGDKVMRLRAQTAKIEGGFVLFPKEAHWLDSYLLELVTFPNSKNDDQVDSTVFALAWSTLHAAVPGIIQFYKNEAARIGGNTADQNRKKRVWVAPPVSTWILITGRQVTIPLDRIIEVTEEEIGSILQNGGKRVD
jgi:predicted phage terminase large subunit-like protein